MSTAHEAEQKNLKEKQNKRRLPYQSPAIIFHGTITTRAGSPTLTGDPDKSGVDPADLFGGG
ncbi:MAG: hypothetical protein H6658_13160 [Ardenticatenaceae bacterium]|nr:hypothetical protein [Ardenticatenaceae bacterium]